MNEDERHKQHYLEFKRQQDQDFLLIHRGRMKRLDFFLMSVAIKMITNFMHDKIGDSNLNMLIPLVLVFVYLELNIIFKRTRDMGFSPWFAAIAISALAAVPIYLEVTQAPFDPDSPVYPAFFGGMILLSFLLVFWPSQKRDNQYGRYYPYSYVGGYKTPKA